MIAVAYGTTGELIKLAPVLKALQDRDASPYCLQLKWQFTESQSAIQFTSSPIRAFTNSPIYQSVNSPTHQFTNS